MTYRSPAGWQSEFVPPPFSGRKVAEAGKVLREQHQAVTEELLAAFRMAHAWRASHLLPMRAMRAELTSKVAKVTDRALTAARLKRMTSLRAKLRRAPHSLYQMQDLAGCRAIMPDLSTAAQLLEAYNQGALHQLRHTNDYVTAPKPSGYRGYHLVFRFEGREGQEAWNASPMLVELQVRTRLQHAWATAVEAVGMIRGEELKSGAGDGAWLRFFALMSAEIANREGAAPVPGTPEFADDRHAELVALAIGLDAVRTLERYRAAVKISESARTASPYYLIQFDPQKEQVTVKGVTLAGSASALDDAEGVAGGVNSVLVAVDKIEDLKSAYPNYFMDVKTFTDCLRDVLGPPLQPRAEPMRTPIGLEWFEVVDWWNRRR